MSDITNQFLEEREQDEALAEFERIKGEEDRNFRRDYRKAWIIATLASLALIYIFKIHGRDYLSARATAQRVPITPSNIELRLNEEDMKKGTRILTTADGRLYLMEYDHRSNTFSLGPYQGKIQRGK